VYLITKVYFIHISLEPYSEYNVTVNAVTIGGNGSDAHEVNRTKQSSKCNIITIVDTVVGETSIFLKKYYVVLYILWQYYSLDSFLTHLKHFPL